MGPLYGPGRWRPAVIANISALYFAERWPVSIGPRPLGHVRRERIRIVQATRRNVRGVGRAPDVLPDLIPIAARGRPRRRYPCSRHTDCWRPAAISIISALSGCACVRESAGISLNPHSRQVAARLCVACRRCSSTPATAARRRHIPGDRHTRHVILDLIAGGASRKFPPSRKGG